MRTERCRDDCIARCCPRHPFAIGQAALRWTGRGTPNGPLAPILARSAARKRGARACSMTVQALGRWPAAPTLQRALRCATLRGRAGRERAGQSRTAAPERWCAAHLATPECASRGGQFSVARESPRRRRCARSAWLRCERSWHCHNSDERYFAAAMPECRAHASPSRWGTNTWRCRGAISARVVRMIPVKTVIRCFAPPRDQLFATSFAVPVRVGAC